MTANGTISITATFTDDDSFKAFATGKYAVAIKEGDFYRTISDSCLLKNPEELARKDDEFKDKYWGYYEGYKVYIKKRNSGMRMKHIQQILVCSMCC